MDPITAIGVLASLSSLITASSSVINVLKSFKDGERELLELLNDVAVFEEALRGFDRVLRSRQTKHNISAPVIQNALEEGSATIQELESRLVQVEKCGSSAVRRMKWVQHKSSFKTLHGRLKAQSTTLQSFLALAHAETFIAVCSQHPQFLEFGLLENRTREDALSTHESITSQNSIVECGTVTSSLRRVSTDTAPSSVGSETSSLRNVAFDLSSKGTLAKGLVDGAIEPYEAEVDATSTSIIRRACRYNCYCKCHARNHNNSSKILARLSELKEQCTDPTCQGAILTSCRSETSAQSFRKVLSSVLSSKSIKIRYDLNTYRMVSEGSDAMRYVKHGNLEKLRSCIHSGEATLWDTAPDGWSLLHTAAYNRQLSIVRYLLDAGADPDVTDVGSRKPADLALLKSLPTDSSQIEKEIVEVFSKKDDYLDDFEFTPIHKAVLDLYDPKDMERPTLEQLSDFVDDANNAPAGTDWAKWKSKYRKRSPFFNDIVEIFRASAYGRPKSHKVIHNLLDKKDKKYCWTPLHWACSTGRADKIKVLTQHGADPFLLSNLNANILHAAAESRTLKGLAGALDIWKCYPKQLNINQANRWAETPLHVAAWGSVSCVKLLLDAGADRNVRQEDLQVPLHCAGLSERGTVRRKIAALLCAHDNKDHVNAQDTDGRPPLFDFLDDPECVELLINNGANLELLDNTGQSVFHHSCVHNESGTLRVLLERFSTDSVMATIKDHDGNTALIQALRHHSLDCARILLRLPNVGDIVGQNGWAAIHYAAKLGDVELLEDVLKHRSFVKGMKTIDGKTAEVVAMESGTWSGQIKALLREHNPKT